MGRIGNVAVGVMMVCASVAGSEEALDAASLERYAGLALECVGQEYPNKIAHVMQSDDDLAPPRELTPAFYGCFDWHSSVHGHWLLARLARLYPDAEFASAAREALGASLTEAKIAAEVEYLNGEGRESFERPYGLAWLLQLAAEIGEWDDPRAERWSSTLEPLEAVTAQRLLTWIPKLDYPIRTGEHSQTAFAFGLVLDWARSRGHGEMEALLERRIRELYLTDRSCPLAYEPSGQDFLSPCLAEADLMRRVLGRAEMAAWLGGFLPQIPLDGGAGWLLPAEVSDRTDGKLAHLDGLNLSRAWMLEGIVSGLPDDDPRRGALQAAADLHRLAGVEAVLVGGHYAGEHWLGSFATYLVTRRGIAAVAVNLPGSSVQPHAR